MIDNLKFKADPFYLYPLKDDMIDHLFINRDEEIKTVRGILKVTFKGSAEICTVIGGIGIGKSSMLHYIERIGEEMGYQTNFHNNPDEFFSSSKRRTQKRVVNLIDDVDKNDDLQARRFYTRLEKDLKDENLIFFSDRFDRDGETIGLRHFTVSHTLSLPHRLNLEELRFFLEERIRRCLVNDSKYDFPFEDSALEMASIRSRGNLRNFLNYVKHGWIVSIGGTKDIVGLDDIKSGMISIDRALLGSLDLIDLRILWYSTIGNLNKSYLAHKCGIDTKTLESRIEGRISDILVGYRSGKDVILSSVYKDIDGGAEILKDIIEDLGMPFSKISKE